MKVAIFSDVHANLPALETFLRATREVDRYVCLGDTVGYGPWPDECAQIVAERCGWARCEGNHERLHLGTERINDQHPLVRAFYRHTREWFTKTHRIEGLAEYLILHGYLFQHIDDGFPRAFVGHSHRQTPNLAGILPIGLPFQGIIHVGSIGQNRAAIDAAEWAELDTESGAITLRCKIYPFDKLLAEMRSRHYPDECIDYYLNKPRAPPP